MEITSLHRSLAFRFDAERACISPPEDEAFFLQTARFGTASHVEKLVRYQRRVERAQGRDEARRQHDGREVRYRWDEDGTLVQPTAASPPATVRSA